MFDFWAGGLGGRRLPFHVCAEGVSAVVMFVMRFTVIDHTGTVSFVAPCTALKALVAACSKAPSDLEGLLSASTRYDNELKDYVDEQRSQHSVPPLRGGDDATRRASLEPVKAGLVLFNLKDRRIVQVHN